MWTVRDVDEAEAQDVARLLSIDPLIARCLLGRGVTAEEAEAFVKPRLTTLRPPKGLAGLPEAMERLERAVTSGEVVGCFGDYDVDGVTTCAILSGYLTALGVRTVPRVARRDAGYGFGIADVDVFHKAGCTLVVVGDCGTSDVEAIAHAKTLGIDVAVIDHHTVPDSIDGHPAVALVNPFRPDSTFPFRSLCSAGLAFYVVAALRSQLRKAGRECPDPRDWLDLVAVGTIADLVPLVDENRVLTSLGIRRLKNNPRPGLAALLKKSKATSVDEKTVGWKIGPRLNAPGRLGDATPAFELLMAQTSEEAELWAKGVEKANEDRRAAQDRVWEEAWAKVQAQPERACVVVSGEGWLPGVVGIVAARLVDATGKPAFVIAVDPETGEGRGSARSAKGVHLVEALKQCDDLLVRYGGHEKAAGLTIRSELIEELHDLLPVAVQGLVDDSFDNSLYVDAELSLSQVGEELVSGLSLLAPYGKGNQEPLFAGRGYRVIGSRRVGDGSHLKLTLEDDTGAAREAIGFGMGDLDPGAGALVDAAFVPMVNEFAGRRQVELELRRLKTR